MITVLSRIIPAFFYALFFAVPLVLWPFTSELFEFNKMVFVYLLTLLITASWTARMIQEKKIIFRRTILDIPLLIFLGSQILSTVFSIDTRTSMLGYYSRFNGGLLSTVCYSFLYWAYVSNMNRKHTLSAIRYTLISAALVSLYGILEHFGIDKNLWVQDVQNRVFSTLGQPNWLAAYLVALLPLTWAQAFNSKFKNPIPYLLSILFFITLLFTKSRSGILGFLAADLIFWGIIFSKFKKQYLKEFLIFNILFLVFALIINTPWSPSFNRQAPKGAALETGGTESGQIRKIVWRGAFDIWKHYPFFGSGVETFAFSYYQFRPKEHNLVSEWDFLYNKAHNEYLNLAANTGTVGILAYIILIIFSVRQIITNKDKLNIGLLAGYAGILITNFFGFSVVPVALLFFLFPAMAISLAKSKKPLAESKNKTEKLSNWQITLITITLLATCFTLFAISRYWSADILFNKGRQNNDGENYLTGQKLLEKAVKFSPKEALFHNELAESYAGISLTLDGPVNSALAESTRATILSPANVNLLRNKASLFLKLSSINPKYLGGAKEALLAASTKAPTDAKIMYNLGLIYLRTGETDKSLETLEKTIDLKSNYRDARLAYALTLVNLGRSQEAKFQLQYILDKINPNDKLTREELNKL